MIIPQRRWSFFTILPLSASGFFFFTDTAIESNSDVFIFFGINYFILFSDLFFLYFLSFWGSCTIRGRDFNTLTSHSKRVLNLDFLP